MVKRTVQSSTPLARFITDRLRELGLKQVDFCRQTGFDQGLLSKLQSGVITTVNLESALRLADGLKVPPEQILSLLGKEDAHHLLKKLYGNSLCAQCAGESATPEPVQSITTAAQQAFTLGRDMTPVLVMLRHLSTTRRATTETTTERAARTGHS
ncbi:MAG TPA: helix-turn-helix transcriptional regulator [Pyrinomonadaceae bacterium]|nr:helix-turn-helix transcriptional regulator [Pyrinomonadaceae bacterium]